MEERLWDYIDGLDSPADRKALEALLASDPSVRAQYAELRAVHASLHESGLEEPSMRFTKNVMEAVAGRSIAPATTTYINKRVIRGIAAFFLTLITGILAYALFLGKGALTAGSGGLIGSDAASSAVTRIFTPTHHVPTFTMPALHLDPYVSVFMLVVVVSGLVVLDTFLQRRRKTASSKTA